MVILKYSKNIWENTRKVCFFRHKIIDFWVELTNSLTAWRESFTRSRYSRLQFPTFYRIRRFIIVSRSSCNWTLFWARRIMFTSHSYTFMIHSNIMFPYTSMPLEWTFHASIQTKIFTHFSSPPLCLRHLCPTSSSFIWST